MYNGSSFVFVSLVLHFFQNYVDEERFAQQNTNLVLSSLTTSNEYYFIGTKYFRADFLWLRTCLLYADFVDNCKREDALWLYSMIETISHLDPKWRTNYLMGVRC